MIFNFTPILKRELAQHKGLKIHLSALVRFYQDFSSEVLYEESWATTPIQTILSPQELVSTLQDSTQKLGKVIMEQEMNGSGWKFERIELLELYTLLLTNRSRAPPQCGRFPPR